MQIHPAIPTDRLDARKCMRKTAAAAATASSMAPFCPTSISTAARGAEGGVVCPQQGVDVHCPICALSCNVFVQWIPRDALDVMAVL